MKIRLIALSLLSALIMMSCGISTNFPPNALKGSGKLATETRNVSGFHAVVLAGSGDLTITQGDTESLTIEAEDNLLPALSSDVTAGKLELGTTPAYRMRSIQSTRPIKYTLTVKDLDEVELAGSGNISMEALKTGNAHITLAGSGDITLLKIDGKELATTLAGSGNIELSGKADRQSLTLAGSGTYKAPDLETGTANISIPGSGTATVWAKDSLDVSIAGSGTVNYYGSPAEIHKSILGSGSVNSKGGK